MTTQPIRQGGFTVIEVAVAALVLAIFLTGALGMVVRNNQVARHTQARLNATQAVRAGIDRMNPLLRRADGLLTQTDAIPASDIAAVGSGFFPTKTASSSVLILRIPVFDTDTGVLTSANSYAMLYTDDGDTTLKATYAIFKPDRTLDYKRRDEVLVRDLVAPKDQNGAALPIFSYFNAAGQLMDATVPAAIADAVRVKIALASKDEKAKETATTQLTSEIRLANQSTRRSVDFVVYNSYGTAKTLTAIDISGPASATLTRIEYGTQAVWTGSQALTGSLQRLNLASPHPIITSKHAMPSTLWFSAASQFSGSYDVRYVTQQGEVLTTTFTHSD